MTADRRNRHRRRFVVALCLLGLVVALFASFPGQRLGIAFTLGTGLGTPSLQRKIDALEDRAIRRAEFSNEEKVFLHDFYATLATGAELGIVVRQTGHLMDHYLGGSGEPFRLDPSIFTENEKVRAQASALKRRAAGSPCTPASRFESPAFYMPDRSAQHALFVDNGLGEYLVQLGLARPFVAFAEWDELGSTPG